MSDLDLDKLTNNEVRLKCIEFGFPNVPVTDSSRKILLKRLRDAINNASTKDSTTKASNRRETINIAKTAPPEVDLPKNRRTIGATATISAKEDTTTGIPIATRRRSVQKETTEPIKTTKSVSKTMGTIIIEDDDDLELMNAAENAERESTTSTVPIENIPSRRKSRSVSKGPEIVSAVTAPSSNTTSLTKKRAMTPLIEEKIEYSKKEPIVKNVRSSKSQTVEILSVQSLPTVNSPIAMSQPLPRINVEQPLSRFSMQNTQNTTPSLYSTPPTMSYSVGMGDNTTTTSSYVNLKTYRPKFTAENILNELSDTDTQNDDGCKSPFLSSFARDLERRRSIGRSSIVTSPYQRRSGGGSNYESGIRGRRSSKADASFGQLLIALNRKYHLKTIFFTLAILCVSIFSFIYFTKAK